ncbi:hypothetical protein RHSP_83006 (plasmid) [Rhizobium freirei PRF 81]|uniref:Uncharacterized protein n=1 Tax=Rhizobium freirei PRF 81 TaxID=363754 RepID=N6UYA5_9HYPH|nr:hypothetical protein RHSP_83006 [Rhizobium freirei PRF 81]
MFGSTSPLITTWFIKSGTPHYIGYYMILFCVIVLVAALAMPKPVGRKSNRSIHISVDRYVVGGRRHDYRFQRTAF